MTTGNPRRLILRDDEAAALPGRAVVWREIKRQPPSVEAVRAMSGSGYSWFTDHRSEPGWFRVAGPVWAVRELDETMANEGIRCPWKPGDAAWGAEAWFPDPPQDGSWDYYAFTDGAIYDFGALPERYRQPRHVIHRATWTGPSLRWHSAGRMPRWASRLPRLVVAAVSVEERGGRWGWRIEVEAIPAAASAPPPPSS